MIAAGRGPLAGLGGPGRLAATPPAAGNTGGMPHTGSGGERTGAVPSPPAVGPRTADGLPAGGGSSLELHDLARRFGDVVALDGLSMTVPPGQVVGFLGPNGAGKTTAMRAVFGLVRLDRGDVLWRGAPVGPADRRRFGYMPEERGLYPGMVVRDQLEYLGRLHGMLATEARAAADRWLGVLGVSERARSKVESLSLGNQQRVQLAAALLHEPDLLVLDEPLSGLDPVGIDAVGAVLAAQAAAGRTVLFSSHQLDLVEDLCASAAIIDAGRLVAAGSVDELTSAGQRRLVVKVHGDLAGAWAAGLAGASVSRVDGGAVRLVLDPGADPQRVLAAAMAAGPVETFAVERRRLSEVFLEAVGASPAAGRAGAVPAAGAGQGR